MTQFPHPRVPVSTTRCLPHPQTLPRSTTGDSPAVEAPSTSSKTWVVLGPWAGSLSQITDTLCSNTSAAQCRAWCGPGFSLDGVLQYSQAALSKVSTLLAEAATGILCPSNRLVLVMKTCVCSPDILPEGIKKSVLTSPLCFEATSALGSREDILESGVPIDSSLHKAPRQRE